MSCQNANVTPQPWVTDTSESHPFNWVFKNHQKGVFSFFSNYGCFDNAKAKNIFLTSSYWHILSFGKISFQPLIEAA